jgi:hypothetical protein
LTIFVHLKFDQMVKTTRKNDLTTRRHHHRPRRRNRAASLIAALSYFPTGLAEGLRFKSIIA